VGVVVSLKDLSSSICMWHREEGGNNGKWAVRKVIEIPAEPADPEKLPPLLKGLRQLRRSYRISIFRSMTASSMFPAGVRASSFSMTSQIR
jgi:hypothetical protein